MCERISVIKRAVIHEEIYVMQKTIIACFSPVAFIRKTEAARKNARTKSEE
jgi:hypothetical protein